MTAPKIDRASLVLYKELMAKVSADAEREVKRRMQHMSATERAKFKRLLNNIKFIGDVGKAAGTSRVRRTLLGKWMNTPGISWKINTALNDAKSLARSGNDAEGVLFRAKIAPKLEKDAEMFRASGERDRESRVIAMLAAQNLKAYRWEIVQAANNNDRQFFIDLGRYLAHKISSELCDQLDYDIAELCCKRPRISAKEAVCELRKNGNSINEEMFRMRRKRLKLAKSRPCKM